MFAGYDAEYPAEDYWQIGFLSQSQYNKGGQQQNVDVTKIINRFEVFWEPRILRGAANFSTKYSIILDFDVRQLPESGYLFGGDLNLVFYLQEIDEWKKEQI